MTLGKFRIIYWSTIMLLTNTENSYGLIAKLFHWIMSIIVIAMLVVGFS
ncbi:hypothetical protein [Rickettsia amblyommatis]|nr:hypothetical protein [Rickettsia amblyommatis]KJV94856.1 hypothetical protein RAMDARK_0800 [Rickettsia amblyommatis str. Darkwater]